MILKSLNVQRESLYYQPYASWIYKTTFYNKGIC